MGPTVPAQGGGHCPAAAAWEVATGGQCLGPDTSLKEIPAAGVPGPAGACRLALKGPSVPAPAALGARREPAPSWAPIAAQEGPKCVVAHPDWVLAAAPVPAADAAGAPAGVARASAGQRDEGAAAGSTVAVRQGGFAAGLLCHAARASRVASAAASRLAWPVGEAAERMAQPDLAVGLAAAAAVLQGQVAELAPVLAVTQTASCRHASVRSVSRCC